jgi:hypothetical protein
MIAGIPVVAISAPEYLSGAFNPVTLNISLAALATIALLSKRDMPTAANCRRKPEKNT